MKRSPSSQRAFTLIELLAVIVIVATLASLLVPAISKMQMAGRAGVCVGNLRNIGAAFQTYASDNNGLLPAMRYRDSSVGANPNPGKGNWTMELAPYLEINDNSIKKIGQSSGGRGFFCPEYLREYKTSKTAQGVSSGGYGMARTQWTSYDNRMPVAGFPKPASTILAGDSDDYHLDIDNGTWLQPPGKDGRYGSGDPVRHGKTANYLFVDGHVLALTQDKAQAALLKGEAP